ncbi:MAG: TIGR02588 family protein [Bryobacteraceae bacterium]
MPGKGKHVEGPRWSWVISATGAMLVVCVLVFLTVEAVRQGSSAPDITVEVESIVPLASGQYLVQVRAHNRGGMTAAQVQVDGSLKNGEEVLETRQLTLDYVPSHSYKDGGLFFSRNPEGLTLEIHASGYTEP